MATSESQFDDGTSSIASFEDVGTASRADKVLMSLESRPKTKEDKPADVPDIRYVLQYKSAHGNVINSRESDQPFDLTRDTLDDGDAPITKPVLEIITVVQTVRKVRERIIRSRRSMTSISDSGDGSVFSDDYDEDGTSYQGSEKAKMVIHSKYLINALNAVIGSYPGTNFLQESVSISSPYKPLIHYRDALARYRFAQPACHDEEYAKTTAKHIDVLLGFLDDDCGEAIREEEARHRRSPAVATFNWLWLLLKPGEVVYKQIQDVWTAFVIDTVTAWPTKKNPKRYNISCWDVRFHQGRMRRCFNMFYVATFAGEQSIKTLEVVPAAFFPEDLAKQGGISMAEKQIQMGKLYWELVKQPAYREYDGKLVDRDGLRAGHLTGRVVVDADGYDRFAIQAPDRRRPPPPYHPPPIMPRPMAPGQMPDQMTPLPQFGPRCSCAACLKDVNNRDEPSPLANFEDLDPIEDKPPKNDLFFLVCSPNIPAFILCDRRWGHVSLDKLSDVKCDAESFKYLVLDPGVKLTVKALIGKFASTDGKVSPWPNDFVRNKGEGRIFLLHGSPGVGKTCTAECVAELTRRPLLAITNGDLTHPVDRQLSYFLKLGERYGALVLLDEADVYLEARRARDLSRNALVSVFLRALEYYRGVLFLTTNRVGSFDPAFTSRIHVALHYRRLTDADRGRIWANNFDRLERDSAGKVYVTASAREYVLSRSGGEEAGGEELDELRWNGREIRNALQTAVALAETEAVEEGLEKVGLAARHLRQVAKMSMGFKDFIRKRRAFDEDYDKDGGESDYDGDSVDEPRGPLDDDDYP